MTLTTSLNHPRRAASMTTLGWLLALATTGCFTQHVTTTIKPDGSGTNTLVVAFAKAVIQRLTPGGNERPFNHEQFVNDVKRTIESGGVDAAWNATYEKWSDDEFFGVKIGLSFRSLDDLVKQMQVVRMATRKGTNPEISDWSVSREGDALTFTLRVSTEFAPPADATDTPEVALKRATLKMMESAKVTWTLAAPKWLSVESPESATKRDDNTLTWTVPFDGKSYTFKAVATLKAE